MTIVGARPQFIKAAPVSRAIAEHNRGVTSATAGIAEILVHTGQHYDYEMSQVFFEVLNLAKPAYHLGVGSGSPGWQTAEMIKRTERVLVKEKPDAVLVYGDTNSTLAGALAAAKLHLPVAHVEAGLRSFNRRMPEECNRVLTDHLSSLLFAPTETAVDNLKREGITAGVHLVGDVMYEAAMHHGEISEKESTILQRLGLERKSYSLATVHRAENTDDRERLAGIVQAFVEISMSQPIVWPMHPRTRQRFSAAELSRMESSGLKLINPASYLDMLLLEKGANVILTDSGGVQKEAMWFQVPCVTLRDETEWIETVERGWNQIAGSRQDKILGAFQKALQRVPRQIQTGSAMKTASRLIVEQLQLFLADRTRELAASI